MERAASRFIVTGRVQAVGFRYWAQKSAIQLHITGWVRNNPDGAVEILAEGDQKDLTRLHTLLKSGPSLSHVTGVEILPVTPTQVFKNFSVESYY